MMFIFGWIKLVDSERVCDNRKVGIMESRGNFHFKILAMSDSAYPF